MSTITIPLPDEALKFLRSCASAQGTSVEAFLARQARNLRERLQRPLPPEVSAASGVIAPGASEEEHRAHLEKKHPDGHGGHQRGARRLPKLERAIALDGQRKIPLGKAAELAGIERAAFQNALHLRGLTLNYGVSDLDADVLNLGESGQK